MPQADIGTTSSRSSGRANSESPTPGPRGDLARSRLEVTGNGYMNMCQPEEKLLEGHFLGGTKRRVIGH